MPPQGDLRACDARLDWVAQTLNALNQETRTWISENDPHAVAPEYHPEADIYALRLSAEPPPFSFAITASNVVHQLRATLDNLVWQLVLANGRKPTGGVRGNSFPILLPHHDHHAFAKNTVNALRGVHPDHRTVIEGLQPYQHPCNPPPFGYHPLRELKKMSDADKHRELEIGAMRGRSDVPPRIAEITGEGIESWDYGWIDTSQILEPGAIVGWLQVRPSGNHPNMNVEIAAMCGLAFRRSERDFRVLRATLAAARDIVTAFVPTMIGLGALPVEVIGDPLAGSYDREALADPLTPTSSLETTVWKLHPAG